MTTVRRVIAAEAGQVSAWLVKMLLAVAVVGFIVLEGGSLVFNRLQAPDIAATAAQEAGLVYSNSNVFEAAKATAEEYVTKNGGEFVEFKVDPVGRRVSVRMKKTAKTFVVKKIERLHPLAVVEVTESAPLRT
ncbi:MAG TPA: hypothetical protein VNE62_10160 [Actinomycetota bacterium]|nr:hypothetical protein [Actinomycetota bacterium]